jgi:magnesium-transporting ATPase (P-type)
LAFVTLVIGNLGLIVVSRSNKESIVRLVCKKNTAQWWIIVGTGVALIGIVQIGLLRSIFHFAPVGADNVFKSIFVCAVVIGWFELVKQLSARRP